MLKITFTTQGFGDLDKALGELPKRTARAALRRAALSALESMADRARQMAPTRYFSLVRSITVSAEKPEGYEDAGKAAFARTMHAGGTRAEAAQALRAARSDDAFVEVYMGPGRHPQAVMQEYGTIDHPPQAYMRPAFDGEADRAFKSMADFLATEIKKSAQRIAKRKLKGK